MIVMFEKKSFQGRYCLTVQVAISGIILHKICLNFLISFVFCLVKINTTTTATKTTLLVLAYLQCWWLSKILIQIFKADIMSIFLCHFNVLLFLTEKIPAYCKFKILIGGDSLIFHFLESGKEIVIIFYYYKILYIQYVLWNIIYWNNSLIILIILVLIIVSYSKL